MALIAATVLFAKSRDSVPSVSRRSASVVFSTAGLRAEESHVIRHVIRHAEERHPESLARLAGFEPMPLSYPSYTSIVSP